MSYRTYVTACLLVVSSLLLFSSTNRGVAWADETDAGESNATPAVRDHPMLPGAAENAAGPDLSMLTTNQLIDRLTEVSEEGLGFHSTAMVGGFIALDNPPQFRGGILGSHAPVDSQVMKEIVRRGVDAMPDLLAHLQDKRETKLTVGKQMILAAWFDTEYHSRHANREPIENEERHVKMPYRLRVGDLCFVAIGQIVNRQLLAARYQPTACLVINSPVETPALAQAVREDWANLTKQEHRQDLLDACFDIEGTDWQAWQRLWVYYPEIAEQTALKLLHRQMYDHSRVWSFINDPLLIEPDPQKWQPLVDQFVKDHGPVMNEVLPVDLSNISHNTYDGETKEEAEVRSRANKIVQQLYPEFVRTPPTFINAVSLTDQSTAIESLSACRSAAIDQAVYDIFQIAKTFPLAEDEELQRAVLVDACLTRLASVNFVPDGNASSLWDQTKSLVENSPIPQDEYGSTGSVALKIAIQSYPTQSQTIFENYRCATEDLTRAMKMNLLRDPTNPQPWMTAYLTAQLDNKTETGDTYGEPWDRQKVRICDEAAQILADGYLGEEVRFEFEKDAAYLDGQIAKIRQVLAGEQGITFGPPPRLEMPQELPSRPAKFSVNLDSDYGVVGAISNAKELWIPTGFQGRGGWAYDFLKYDVEQKKVIQRVPIDQWKGGVNWLRNGQPNRVYCYHGYEGGDVVVREIPSGRLLKKISTPFHNGLDPTDPLQIRNFSDITVCGDQDQWIVAITGDRKLHSIDTETSEHRVEWQDPRAKGSWSPVRMIGIQHSSKVLCQDFGHATFSEYIPAHLWDQSTRTMQLLEKMPHAGWKKAWGDLAWNVSYGESTFWNLATRKQIELPYRAEPIETVACDRDQSTMFVLRDGAIDVFHVENGESLRPIHRLASMDISELESKWLVVSADEKLLFVFGAKKRNEQDSKTPKTDMIIAFDISDLTR